MFSGWQAATWFHACEILSNTPTLRILCYGKSFIIPHPWERKYSQMPRVCLAPLPWGLTLTGALVWVRFNRAESTYMYCMELHTL